MKKCLNTVTVVSFTLLFLFSCASVEEVQTQAPVKEVALVQTPAPETVKVVQETPKPEPSPAPVAVVEKGPAVLVPIPEGRPLGITEEIEANNTVQTANYVDLGKSFTLRINPKGDNDWFRVFVQQQGYLQVQAKDAPKGLGLDIKYCTYDEWDGTKVIRDWSRIPDGCFVMPGEHYLCLNDDWNDSASDQAFSLRIGFLPAEN
ncbi:hypothetical protein MASR2M48_12970 [Spirochaetota bacterium]